MHHTSPTDDELSGALIAQATPSLAVDTIRSVEFLTPKGNKAVLTYPNLFKAEGSDVVSVRAWLKNTSDTDWNRIISEENAKSMTPLDVKINTLIGARNLPASPIDWNSLISDDLIIQVLRARNFLSPDVTKKYKSLIETALSYSHQYPDRPLTESPPEIPRSGSGYDIAYL